MIVHTDGGDRTTACDGNNGWMAAPAADKPFPVISYTGGDLDGVRLDAMLSLPAGIKQAITRPVVGSTTIDDKDVMLVQGTANGGRSSIKLYFDKQSGLLVRQVRFADTITITAGDRRLFDQRLPLLSSSSFPLGVLELRSSRKTIV